MILRPFFTFYGGKWRAARHYPAPKHSVIIEPFSGSAGYALNYADRDVVLVEKDPIIVATWRYLIGVDPRDVLALPDVLPGQTVDDLDVCDGARYLIGWWLNKGSAGPRKSPSSWMRGGTRPLSYWGDAIRSRIADQVAVIRHWQIIDGDYTMSPSLEATWFIDPPYEMAGRHYRFGSNLIRYDDLADWCYERRGQVIVCEQEGASWLPFVPWKCIKVNPSSRGKGGSKEVIWTNDAAGKIKKGQLGLFDKIDERSRER